MACWLPSSRKAGPTFEASSRRFAHSTIGLHARRYTSLDEPSPRDRPCGSSTGFWTVSRPASERSFSLEDVAFIVDTPVHHVHAVVADAKRRVAGFSVSILAREDVVGRDIDAILGDLGVARRECFADMEAIREQPADGCELLVADVQGLGAAERQKLSTLARPHHGRPLVVVTSAASDEWRNAAVVRKPFSARGLRDAVLDAIGA
jgi:hypothetical protein